MKRENGSAESSHCSCIYIPRQLRRKVVLIEVCVVRRGRPDCLANQPRIDLSHAFAAFQSRANLIAIDWVERHVGLTLSDRIKASKAMQMVEELELKCSG